MEVGRLGGAAFLQSAQAPQPSPVSVARYSEAEFRMPGRRRPAAGRGGKKKAEAGEAKPKERKQRPKKEVEEDEMDYAEPVRVHAARRTGR